MMTMMERTNESKKGEEQSNKFGKRNGMKYDWNVFFNNDGG